ncbi:MAG: NACHT domain-containing protein [Candidatus Electrothrix sp. YB6]
MGALSRAKKEKYTCYQQQLQSRCEQQHELLRRLQRDHAIVTDPAVKFEREQQIEAARSECKQIRHDLSLLEDALRTGDDSRVPARYQRKPKAESPARQNLLTLLQGVKSAWIEGVLKQSLHNEVLIELRKTQEDDAVDRLEQPLNLSLDKPDASEETILLDEDIQETYEEAGGTLLILGAPGAGKTISLLDLTRRLANDAVFDSDQPIPVVFNLSSYTDKRQSLADWLVDELWAKYRIPTKIGRKWIEDTERRPLVLMLDGLDEVAEDLRPACVQAVNSYREQYALRGIVVACRHREYREISGKLKLEQALCVQPLTDRQVEDYLTGGGEELAGLHAALPADEGFRELARSPLILSMMCLAYRDQPVETILQDVAGTAETRQPKLFAAYVQSMFRRPRSGVEYEEEKTRRWLTFLAYNMQKHGQTIFQIENLQPSWLLTKGGYSWSNII